ncbi:MAG: GC-type dockerin domain-anchored protein, partial [Phycisphaerales bacterium]
AGMLTFKADNTFAGNPNANALRWGTMYTFWFDANVAPMSGQGRITLFKPAYTGTDASNAAAAPSGRTGNDEALWAFANGLQVPAYCTADIASPGGDLVPDGHTTVDDLIAYLTQFFAGNIAIADLATLGGGPGAAGDGQITVDDLVYFLAAFFSNCN